MSDDKNHISIGMTPITSRPSSRNTNTNNLDPNTETRNSRRNSPNRGAASPNRRDRSPRRNRRSASTESTGLLETEEFNPNQPPIAGPEIDDDMPDDDIPYTPDARPGVDESFFPEKTHPNEPRNRRPSVGVDVNHLAPPSNNGHTPRPQTPNGLHPTFPYAPGFGPVINEGPELGTRIIPDVNVYQHKKTLAQGMMDLALLSANANQLRYVVESYQRHPYYYFSVVFISASLILQVAVGVGLIWNSRYNVKNEEDICKADRINNFTVMGIFLITVVNVFVAAFGVAPSQPTT